MTFYQCAPLECSAHWQIITGLLVILPNSVASMDYFTTCRDTIFFFINYVIFKDFIYSRVICFGFFFFSTIHPSILENEIKTVNQFLKSFLYIQPLFSSILIVLRKVCSTATTSSKEKIFGSWYLASGALVLPASHLPFLVHLGFFFKLKDFRPRVPMHL